MNSKQSVSRRRFFKHTAAGSASLVALTGLTRQVDSGEIPPVDSVPLLQLDHALDLSPASWIWYPCERVLQNTVVLFRRSLRLAKPIKSATGWILGDSRYKLYVNGQYLQFGPAPSDPRWSEADPVDLTAVLQTGSNTIGAQVLYYGQGDGTWPTGKPGFIFKLDMQFEDGSQQTVISDETWQTYVAQSWPPGRYKRWYLRAFQEEFDARLYPYGWTSADFQPDSNWLPAFKWRGASDKPALATSAPDYLYNSGGQTGPMQLRKRSIPLMRESDVSSIGLVQAHTLHWNRPVPEYFDMKTPNAYVPAGELQVTAQDQGWTFQLEAETAAVLTFEFPEQFVGWPTFEIEAPAGTTIELMVQEAHEPFGTTERAPALMNNKFHSWTRFICKPGRNRFETFDYESFRWLQLHIHNTRGTVVVRNVGARQRLYDWPRECTVEVSDNKIQQVVDAAINTVNNSGQDIIVDGMARERQQYSGDIGHMLHATILGRGAVRQAARYVNTYSQGLTKDGYFMDCWPAYDRLNRIAQRQLDLTRWGPLVDHGVGFNFDCYYYYMYTGDLDALREVFPRLQRFFLYLQHLQQPNGLLPTEDLGTPTVWIEHGVSKRHIQCSFNLYTSAMLKHAFAPLCRAFDAPRWATEAERYSDDMLKHTIKHFWSAQHRLFISNLPWLQEEGSIQLHDRTLATALLFDQCPSGDTAASVEALVAQPDHLHLSYPPNAGWLMWALAKAGRTDKILQDLRGRWYTMPSVAQNNTLGEWFDLEPDSHNQWCHAPVAPVYVMYMSLAGIRPLSPGFERVEIRPQVADLSRLQLSCFTPKGDIQFVSTGNLGNRDISITLPEGCAGELLVPAEEALSLPSLPSSDSSLKRFELSAGHTHNLSLKRI